MDWWVWAIIIFIVLGVIGSNKEKEEKRSRRYVRNSKLRRHRPRGIWHPVTRTKLINIWWS